MALAKRTAAACALALAAGVGTGILLDRFALDPRRPASGGGEPSGAGGREDPRDLPLALARRTAERFLCALEARDLEATQQQCTKELLDQMHEREPSRSLRLIGVVRRVPAYSDWGLVSSTWKIEESFVLPGEKEIEFRGRLKVGIGTHEGPLLFGSDVTKVVEFEFTIGTAREAGEWKVGSWRTRLLE